MSAKSIAPPPTRKATDSTAAIAPATVKPVRRLGGVVSGSMPRTVPARRVRVAGVNARQGVRLPARRVGGVTARQVQMLVALAAVWGASFLFIRICVDDL